MSAALWSFELVQGTNAAAVPPGNDIITSSLQPQPVPSRFSRAEDTCGTKSMNRLH